MQLDGRLIIGGNFTQYNSFQANGITRINTGTGNQGRMAATPTSDVETNSLSETYIYPNPSSGVYNLDLSNEIESFNDLKVFNILGQKILIQTIKNKSMNEIDLTNCANGVYFIRLENDYKNIEFKIIKQ